jgi:hypothetical protein
MKTKTFLLLCLLSGIGLAQLSAQSDTKSISYSEEWSWGYFTPVYCNGVQVDYVTGYPIAHVTAHFVDGTPVSSNVITHGEVYGEHGEVFKLSELDKNYIGGTTWHFNLRGNLGNHYMGTVIWDWINDPYMANLVIDKAVCVENGKK